MLLDVITTEYANTMFPYVHKQILIHIIIHIFLFSSASSIIAVEPVTKLCNVEKLPEQIPVHI